MRGYVVRAKVRILDAPIYRHRLSLTNDIFFVQENSASKLVITVKKTIVSWYKYRRSTSWSALN